MRALMLAVGEERYALALQSMQEVIEAPQIVRVPSRAPHVRGVFNLRGELITALDTGALLGITAPAASREPTRWWAVLRGVGEGCALAAADCPRRVELEERAGRGDSPAVAGRYLVDGEAVALLSVEGLLGAVVDGPPT